MAFSGRLAVLAVVVLLLSLAVVVECTNSKLKFYSQLLLRCPQSQSE
jgi:hypothetical protein